MPRTLADAAEKGWAVVGAAGEDGAMPLASLNVERPTLLVMGAEGGGGHTAITLHSHCIHTEIALQSHAVLCTLPSWGCAVLVKFTDVSLCVCVEV